MHITKAAEYALCAAAALAAKPGRVMSAPRLAADTHIPSRFLAKILRRLTRAGLLRSSPGSRGGFVLARAASTVSVWDVIAATEPAPALNACVGPGAACEQSPGCGLHAVFQRAQAAMEMEFRRATLDEVARRAGALRTWPQGG